MDTHAATTASMPMIVAPTPVPCATALSSASLIDEIGGSDVSAGRRGVLVGGDGVLVGGDGIAGDAVVLTSEGGGIVPSKIDPVSRSAVELGGAVTGRTCDRPEDRFATEGADAGAPSDAGTPGWLLRH